MSDLQNFSWTFRLTPKKDFQGIRVMSHVHYPSVQSKGAVFFSLGMGRLRESVFVCAMRFPPSRADTHVSSLSLAHSVHAPCWRLSGAESKSVPAPMSPGGVGLGFSMNLLGQNFFLSTIIT